MTYRVVFDPAAQAELLSLHDYILDRTGNARVAETYVRRIAQTCLGLAEFPLRGTPRDDIRPGLRTIVFERRATIAYVVETSDVTVLRILHRGRDIDALLAP